MPKYQTHYGEHAFVRVNESEDRKVYYQPVRTMVETEDGKLSGGPYTVRLMEGEGGYAELKEAQAIVDRFNLGHPEENCIEARWDSMTGYWIGVEYDYTPSSWRDDPEARAERAGYTW